MSRTLGIALTVVAIIDVLVAVNLILHNGTDDAVFVILWLVNGWAAWTAGREVLARTRVSD